MKLLTSSSSFASNRAANDVNWPAKGRISRQESKRQEVSIIDDTWSTVSSVSGYTDADTPEHEKNGVFNFSSIGIHGREEEKQTLATCLTGSRFSRQLVFISGEAGSGKSALTSWLENQAVQQDFIFVAGKHTLAQREEPYVAFSQICRRLCLDIVGNDDSVGTVSTGWSGDKLTGLWCTDGVHLSETLLSELGSHAQILSRVVPALKLVLGEAGGASASTSGVRLDERNQLHSAFRSLFRVLNRYKPLVLVLDDLQWCDQASLDLLEYIASDHEMKAVMLVGCFRDNEVDEDHPFANSLASMCEVSSKDDQELKVTQLKVNNLSVGEVNSLVCSILAVNSAEETLPLAKVIHSRTLGNAFFSLQFLKLLADDKLIEMDKTSNKFIWNIDQVKLTTTATADAVELMQTKLSRLPITVRTLVRLASALGTSVHFNLFKLIVDDFYRNKQKYCPDSMITKAFVQKELSPGDVLALMVKEGLMFRSEKRVYRWEHDKILEAASTGSKVGKIKECLLVGEVLQQKLTETELDHHIFAVVRLLNAGSQLIPTTDSHKRVNLAELNLRAGKKSFHSSGFASAQMHFNQGISLLPSNHRRVYRALSLDLFSSAAESEYCVGDVDRMEKHCQDVISRPFISLEEKRRAYTTLMDGLNGQGKCSETVDLSIDLLGKLGCSIPKRCLLPRILSGIMQVKSIEKRGIKAELDKVPSMSDPYKLWAMDILGDLFKYAYLADMPNLVAVVLLKSWQWSIKYGRSPKVSMVLAQVGMLASSIGEYSIGRSYIDESLAELNKSSSDKLKCDVYALIYTLSWHWTSDVDTHMLASGHAAGYAAGVAENSSWNIEHSLKHRLFIGSPLAVLRDDALRYVREMKDLKVQKPHDLTMFGLQATINLIGDSKHTSQLAGSLFTATDLLEQYKAANDNLSISVMRLFQFFLAFVFDDFARAMEIQKEHSEVDIEKSIPGQFGLCMMYYCNAMASISMYRKTGSLKHKRAARRLSKKIHHWANTGNPNVLHHSMMLDAEFADLNRDDFKATKNFECAILRAEKRGLIHDVAKGEQRYGEFLLRKKRTEEASLRVHRAVAMYDRWGAFAVGNALRKRYSELLCPMSSVELLQKTDSGTLSETNTVENQEMYLGFGQQR